MIKSNIEYPHSTYNPALDKYDDVVLFKEKLERAKLILAKAGIPERWKQELVRKDLESK